MPKAGSKRPAAWSHRSRAGVGSAAFSPVSRWPHRSCRNKCLVSAELLVEEKVQVSRPARPCWSVPCSGRRNIRLAAGRDEEVDMRSFPPFPSFSLLGCGTCTKYVLSNCVSLSQRVAKGWLFGTSFADDGGVVMCRCKWSPTPWGTTIQPLPVLTWTFCSHCHYDSSS